LAAPIAFQRRHLSLGTTTSDKILPFLEAMFLILCCYRLLQMLTPLLAAQSSFF